MDIYKEMNKLDLFHANTWHLNRWLVFEVLAWLVWQICLAQKCPKALISLHIYFSTYTIWPPAFPPTFWYVQQRFLLSNLFKLRSKLTKICKCCFGKEKEENHVNFALFGHIRKKKKLWKLKLTTLNWFPATALIRNHS